jgi:molybdopterin converting factor small subunit
MRLKLTYGREELLSQFSAEGRVNVKQLLQSVKDSHPHFYQRWCELKEGDEVYIIPLITGG